MVLLELASAERGAYGASPHVRAHQSGAWRRSVLARLPKKVAYSVAAAQGRRCYRKSTGLLSGSHPAILRDCLDASPEQLDRWAELQFEHAFCDRLEWQLLSDLDHGALDAYVDVGGRDHIDDALSRGKGAILYSAHLRGLEQFFAAVALLGFAPNIVGGPRTRPNASGRRAQEFERRDAILRELGCRFHLMSDERLVAVSALRDERLVALRAVSALRRNEVVMFTIDHDLSARFMEVEFMGRPARIPLGPLLVAQSTGAPFLPYWLHRPPGRRPLVAQIGRAIDPDDDLAETARRLLAPMEENVRRHPDIWATWLYPEAHFWLDSAPVSDPTALGAAP